MAIKDLQLNCEEQFNDQKDATSLCPVLGVARTCHNVSSGKGQQCLSPLS